MNDLAVAFRIIPNYNTNLDGLGTPAIFKEFVQVEKGLILVTGLAGSGKSTTLGALLNEINETYAKHILTIEDPVELVRQKKKSIFV